VVNTKGRIRKGKILILSILIVVLSGCHDDDLRDIKEMGSIVGSERDLEQRDIEEELPIGDDMIIGKRLKNPFAIENINKAIEVLNTNRDTPSKETPYTATHIYVKFSPKTASHCQTLVNVEKKGDIVLHAYPLDAKILQQGATPITNGMDNASLNELYAVLPIEASIPDVPYIILDKIVPEITSEAIEVVSFVLTGNGDEIQPDLKLEHVLDLDQKAQKAGDTSLGLLSQKWTPSGNILVEDTGLGRGVGLANITVSIGSWFKWTRVLTNRNGSFRSNQAYRSKKVQVRSKWKSPIASIRKKGNMIHEITMSDYMFTLFKKSNAKTHIIKRFNKDKWFKGTIQNALVKTNDFYGRHEMSGKIQNANILIHSGKYHKGTTLMYHRFPQIVSLNTSYKSWLNWLGMDLVFPENFEIHYIYPDVFLSIDNRSGTRSIERLVFHEMSHYMHAIKAGEHLWGALNRCKTNNILNKGEPYGKGINPSKAKGEMIALAEGWAKFIEYKMMEELYGSERNTKNMEDFVMFSRPCNQKTTDSEHWFASGLFWDLYDVNTTQDNIRYLDGIDGSTISLLTDKVEGDYAPIYDLLDKNTKGINDLKQRIISAYPQIKLRTLDTFKAYGY